MTTALAIAALVASLALLFAASAYAFEIWLQLPSRQLWPRPKEREQPEARVLQEGRDLEVPYEDPDRYPGGRDWLGGQIFD